MARTQFTFTFTNAQPGAKVHFSAPVYADATTATVDGPTLVLSPANSVAVYADAGFLIAATVDGNGNEISATATAATASVTTDTGTAGQNPFSNGAPLLLAKQAGAATNPGADLGRLYFRAGTNAGTLKLVARAGTAGAETTVLDNIPQT